jgi:hypothetical protein
MSETHVISALIAKRAELSGQMAALDKQKAALRLLINHIDHSLAIFGYKDPPRAIKPVLSKNFIFERRELPVLMRRFAVDGVNNRQIAEMICAHKGWDAGDLEVVARVRASVKGAKNWTSRKARGAA